MKVSVTTTHLEMRSPEALRRARRVPDDVLLLRAGIPSPELNRAFYTGVGGDWFWMDRLSWTWDQWMSWLSRPEVETWIAHQAGTPAGYFELELQPEQNVEIVYFGVLPGFAGKGIGGYLLSQAVHRAWVMGPVIGRVSVHTCSLDHPAALRNYLARGFSVFKEAVSEMELPHEPPGPWPGAARPR
jgi:GNAT superfamily N-acetyltransferase